MLTIEQIVQDVQSLPMLNEVVTKLLRLLEDPEVSVNEVSDLINLDQGLTADILKLCNSACFGLPRRIDSIHHAAVLLGTDILFELTLTAIAGNYLAEAQRGYSLPQGVLWHFSLACAIASGLLAEELRFPDRQCLYTAALLQEVGKLILDPYLEPLAEDLGRLVLEEKTDFCVAERQLLGVDHAEAGGAMLSHWKLPDRISAAVKYHHQPEANDISRELSDLIQLSDMLVESLGMKAFRESACYALDVVLFEQAGVASDRIPELTEALSTRLTEAEELIHRPA